MSGRLLAALRGWGLAALGAAMLMWSALVSGRPPVFTDTALYYSQAEYLFEALHLVDAAHAVSPPGDPTALPATPGAPDISASIDGARSPLYGALVYALQRLGGLWLVAYVQALAAAGMIYLLYRAAAPTAARWVYLAMIAGLAALTPLPFFASWIMPDLFAGVSGCGLILLLVYPDRLGPTRLIGAAALTTYGFAVHRSNLLDAAATAAAGAALLALGGLDGLRIWRRIGLVAAMGLTAVVAGSLFYAPIGARAGEPIGTPPFLSARVLADGPGRTYLRHVCRDAETLFALCAFRNRPLATSDQILWSLRRATSVFVAAQPAVRQSMERQDARFALGATLAHPMAQLKASAANAWSQFILAQVDEPMTAQGFYVRDPYWKHTALPRILPDALGCGSPKACAPPMSKTTILVAQALGLGVGVLALAWRLSAADIWAVLLGRAGAGWRDPRVRMLTALALTLILLAANAAACGALSGPFPRYQARLIWLAPMMAALTLAALGWRRRPANMDYPNRNKDIEVPATSLDAPAGGL